MRINTTRPICLNLNQGGWEHEYLLLEDAVHPTLGVVELDIIDDSITQQELFDVKSDGTETFWTQRRIVGQIERLLPNWPDLMVEMPSISLPEEAKVYYSGEAIVTFDPKSTVVQLVVQSVG